MINQRFWPGSDRPDLGECYRPWQLPSQVVSLVSGVTIPAFFEHSQAQPHLTCQSPELITESSW